LIDTHAHIDSNDFDADRDEVIHRSFDSGVTDIIIPAIEPMKFENLIRLGDSYSKIKIGMGIHPHNAKEIDSVTLNEIYDEAKKNPKVLAIGEIGLDYYYDFAPVEVQKRGFRDQLEIAKELDLPVIIHNRDSDEDLLSILEEAQDGKLKGVLHCFSGNVEFLNKALALDLLVSFTGNVTFKKFDSIDMIKSVPLNKFMLETDSPYMTPVPFRGKRNEPKFVKLIAEKIAEIKSIDIKEVINMTTENAKRLFRIALFLTVLMPIMVYAQYNESDDEYYDDYESKKPAYAKTLGFGPVLGTNTIVESFPKRENYNSSISYEGLLAYGGIAHYGLYDYFILSASYVYSKNTKLQEKFENLEPNTHTQVELTANFIVNPNGVINLYGFVGPSYLINSYGSPSGGIEDRSNMGINTGLGFFFNFPISGAGLITLSAEWKLNFMLGSQSFDYDSRLPQGKQEGNPVEISTFFSIPRINLIFYPF